jgi:hypothetical protein
VTKLPDGRTVNTCPSAGECAPLCYARKGTYQFSNVRGRHISNLLRILDDLEAWELEMSTELDHPRFQGGHIRIHDAGDFFSDAYLEAWLRIARAHPETIFYCYTKEIDRFRRLVEPAALSNFRSVYSFGERQDHKITEADRQCDVFPSDEKLEEAGFHDQADSDLLAIYGPARVGIVVNNHPGAVRAMRGLSLSELQKARHPSGRAGTHPSPQRPK